MSLRIRQALSPPAANYSPGLHWCRGRESARARVRVRARVGAVNSPLVPSFPTGVKSPQPFTPPCRPRPSLVPAEGTLSLPLTPTSNLPPLALPAPPPAMAGPAQCPRALGPRPAPLLGELWPQAPPRGGRRGRCPLLLLMRCRQPSLRPAPPCSGPGERPPPAPAWSVGAGALPPASLRASPAGCASCRPPEWAPSQGPHCQIPNLFLPPRTGTQ